MTAELMSKCTMSFENIIALCSLQCAIFYSAKINIYYWLMT